MQFIDKDNYENILNINKLNKKIHLINLEIKEYESKKKSNIYFLKIQLEQFNNIYSKKQIVLKKYYIRIIKTAIIIYQNKKKINELYKILNNNILSIQKLNYELRYINYIDLLNNKKIITKYNRCISELTLLKEYKIVSNSITKKNYNIFQNISKIYNTTTTLIRTNIQWDNLNNIKILNNLKNRDINFYLYILYYNIKYTLSLNEYIINEINIYFIKLEILNIEFTHYFKFKVNINKNIEKVNNNSIKNNKLLFKYSKQNDILLKKSEDIKNKYNFNQKYITIQEHKNLKLQYNFIKNIHELNIRIELNTQLLNQYQSKINGLEDIVKFNDNIHGKLLKNTEQCMICLEDIKYGITTNCNHNFHYSCINLYVFNIIQHSNKIEIKCPICRQFI